MRLGELNFDPGQVDGASPVDIKVDKTIPHANYSTTKRIADIGLVKLMNKVTYTSKKLFVELYVFLDKPMEGSKLNILNYERFVAD